MPEAKRRLLRNVSANVLYLLAATGVGVWQVPYLIGRLGVAAYGQIGVLQAVVNYGSLLTFAVTWTICRFMALRLGRDDTDGANAYFNTALFALFALAALLLAVAVAARPYVPVWLDSPAGFRADVGRLLVLFVLASCLNACNSPFLSVPFARHRFDLINVIRAFGMALQVAVLVAAFTRLPARLAHYGWAIAAKEGAVLLLLAWTARHLWPPLRIGASRIRWHAFRDMAVMSLWSVVDRIGFLLYFNIDLILINAFLGAERCGRYAPLTQLCFLFGLFTMALVQTFWPIAYERIAREDIDTLVAYARRTTRFMGLALGLPVGLLCGLAGPLLTVWLGPAWVVFAPLLMLLVGPLILSFPLRHLFSITHGLNKVRPTALITLAGGLVNLVLSVVLLRLTPLGMAGVALATGLSLTLRNTLVLPLYCAAILRRPRRTFFGGLLPGVMAALITALAGLALQAFFTLDSIPAVLAAGAGLAAVYVPLVCFRALSGGDRAFLVSLLRKRTS
ncbi:MAG: lipopolysaccharide biosynthesis protein [Lentisphaerae bacterium]|nr:lipopolysaccharide biosynthesis protein [Lentisphaerota bacterium]